MSSPYINRFLQPDTVIPDLSNPQSWNRFSYAFNNPILYRDPSGHGPCKDIKDIAECLEMGLSILKSTVAYIKDNPVKISKHLKFDLPVVIPTGIANSGLVPGVYKHSVDLKFYGRIGGRAIGDDMFGPVVMFAGAGLSILPNQIENRKTGAKWNEYVGDFIVDAAGFAISEGFGDAAAFVLAETGPGAIAGNFIVDTAASFAWDRNMENGGRKAAVDFIGQIPSTIKTINQAVNSTYNYYPPVPESPRPWEQIYPPLGTPSP